MNLINRIFNRRNKPISGVILAYHGQEDIHDMGFHHVTLKLEDGTQINAALQSNQYKPFEVGETVTGIDVSGAGVPVSAPLVVANVAAENSGAGNTFSSFLLRPLRGIFEDLASVEGSGSNPIFSRLAHKAGSTIYGKNGEYRPSVVEY